MKALVRQNIEELSKCIEYGLAVNFTKLVFYENEVNFLGHIINRSKIKMELNKVETIKNYNIPNCKKRV